MLRQGMVSIHISLTLFTFTVPALSKVLFVKRLRLINDKSEYFLSFTYKGNFEELLKYLYDNITEIHCVGGTVNFTDHNFTESYNVSILMFKNIMTIVVSPFLHVANSKQYYIITQTLNF